MLATLGVALTFVLTIHDFLAISRPVNGDILVVEGWIWRSSAVKEAAEEFNRGHYKWLVTVGESLEDNVGAFAQRDPAVLAAKRLREYGVDEDLIVVLPGPNVPRHRTYASALILKEWLAGSKIETTGVNVFTLGAHARKSLVLFQRVLGAETRVGVIAGRDDSYNAQWWWLSPTGIYVVMRKTLGYLYAVCWPLPQNLTVSSESPLRPTGRIIMPGG
jgi:hypothetical protein